MAWNQLWWRLRKSRKAFLVIFLVWSLLEVMHVKWHLRHSPDDASKAYRSAEKQKIFIASTHWNNEAMLRRHWSAAVLQLTRHLGAANVFVSVVESGSWDDTKGALGELDAQLESAGVRRSVVTSNVTHADEVSGDAGTQGWAETAEGVRELRRIPYLSRIRNRSLEPLGKLAAEGVVFDKVLFLNDVVFDVCFPGKSLRHENADREQVEDFESLLHTNAGVYAAACSLDFSKPYQVYDTFALRDEEGHEPLMLNWPYFRAKSSRTALKANRAVPVTSCWNGMEPFYDVTDTHALSFRGVSDTLAESHVEGSECCIIHVDNPLSKTKGNWVNPSVRVGYSGAAYEQVRPQTFDKWLSPLRVFVKLWENRCRRWFTSVWFKENMIRDRIATWSAEALGRIELGGICLINEMQVIRANGWAHV